MGTNCTIAMKVDGGYKAIYCHWDGNPEHVGRILREYYMDPAKVKKLIALGAISSLRREVGVKHPFNSDDPKYDGMTTAYKRDRGEKPTYPWQSTQYAANIDALVRIADQTHAYFLYIFENGAWKMYARAAGGYYPVEDRLRGVV